MAKQPSGESGINLEQELQRLEDIQQKIQKATLPFDESMALFNQGKEIIARCMQYLDQAEQRIENMGENG